MLFQMDQALVGVHHLLQVDVLFYDVNERILGIVFFVHLHELIQLYLTLHHQSSEDTASKVTTVRDEIDFRIVAVLQLLQRLLDFRHMLMAERLVDAHVVVTPAEVTGCTRLHACTGTTGNGIDHDIVIEQQVLCQWQQAQLDTSSEATRIGHVLALADGATVQFRQTVDEVVVVALDTVVHAEVDNLQVFRHIVAFHELLGIAVSCTEEEDIDFVQRKLVGKH